MRPAVKPDNMYERRLLQEVSLLSCPDSEWSTYVSHGRASMRLIEN